MVEFNETSGNEVITASEGFLLIDFAEFTDTNSLTYIIGLDEEMRSKFQRLEREVLNAYITDFDGSVPEVYNNSDFIRCVTWFVFAWYYKFNGINTTFGTADISPELVQLYNSTILNAMNSGVRYYNRFVKNAPKDLKLKPKTLIF